LKPGSGKGRNTRRPVIHPVTRYAHDVVSGAILAGRLVRLAAERHLRDLDAGGKRGLAFDIAAATRIIEFFGFLRLAEGEHAGKPFKLEPFQAFIAGSLFGWKGSDGSRADNLDDTLGY
jgi:phage terminase large subunit-like protein